MMSTDELPSAIVVTDRARELAHQLVMSMILTEARTVAINAIGVPGFYTGLLAESDRAAGILAFTFIESQISELFAQRLDPDISGGISSIIGQNGILDSVGARLRMLRALHWLRQETYSDLRLLSHIRNRFAHSHLALTFDDAKIRGYFSSLQKHETLIDDLFPSVSLSTKQTFLVRVVMTLYYLYGDLVLMPASLSAGMNPRYAFSLEFEQLPAQLREAKLQCTTAVELIAEMGRQTEGK
jgi:hypothetical protein